MLIQVIDHISTVLQGVDMVATTNVKLSRSVHITHCKTQIATMSPGSTVGSLEAGDWHYRSQRLLLNFLSAMCLLFNISAPTYQVTCLLWGKFLVCLLAIWFNLDENEPAIISRIITLTWSLNHGGIFPFLLSSPLSFLNLWLNVRNVVWWFYYYNTP